jgi:hypothetical protein
MSGYESSVSSSIRLSVPQVEKQADFFAIKLRFFYAGGCDLAWRIYG